MKKKLLVVSVVSGLALAIAVGAAVGRPGEPAPPLSSVANEGVTVGVGATGADLLSRFEIGPSLRRLGEVAGTEFYVGTPTRGSGTCFIVADAGAAVLQPKMLGCQRSGVFPSADVPVVDFSLKKSPADRPEEVYVVELAGFAADGVTSVGVVDVTGNTHWRPVNNNIFAATDIPDVQVEAIVARDANGNIIDRHTFELEKSG